MLNAAQGADEEAVGVVVRGEDGEAVRAGGGAESLGQGGDGEAGSRGEEVFDDIFVFKVAERAGRIDEQAAGGDVLGVAGEDFALALRGGVDFGLGDARFQVRGTAPGAGAAARGVHEHAVEAGVGRGRMLADVDLLEVGAFGAFF